jgi:hypothetical protein
MRLERQPNTRGRFRDFVVLDVEGKPYFLAISGYFADRLRSLQEGDHVEALVAGDFAVELKATSGVSFTYADYATITDKETESARLACIIGAAIFWTAFLVGIVSRPSPHGGGLGQPGPP